MVYRIGAARNTAWTIERGWISVGAQTIQSKLSDFIQDVADKRILGRTRCHQVFQYVNRISANSSNKVWIGTVSKVTGRVAGDTMDRCAGRDLVWVISVSTAVGGRSGIQELAIEIRWLMQDRGVEYVLPTSDRYSVRIGATFIKVSPRVE